MGLPVILSVFNFFSRDSDTHREDPEKGLTTSPPSPTSTNFPLSPTQDEDQDREVGDEVDEDVDDPLTGNRRLHRLGSATTGTMFSSTVDGKTAAEIMNGKQSWLKRVKTFVLPQKESEASLEKFVPNYRWTPILSGVVIPFSILLEIPGLTEHWYIRTEANKVVEIKANSAILDFGLAVSMACALAANVCLVMRFLERRVKTVTILTITFLSIHDIINIVTVIIFGVEHRFDDGFTYGQSFWLTVCSTIVSSVTNYSIIIDYIRTPNFAHSGSGLTRRQRALMIIVIVLLGYIALGALINSLIMDLNFVDGLYFTVVTIETIGFGDIIPTTTGQRVFTCFYLAIGIINVGLAVAMTRETVLEGLELGYRKRLRNLRLRRREARRFRRWEARWRHAVEWRLRAAGRPIWVPDAHAANEDVHFVGLNGADDGAGEVHYLKRWLRSIGLRRGDDDNMAIRIRGNPHGKHLNINALSPQELEAAALEAGVPLEMFLSPVRRGSDSEDSQTRPRYYSQESEENRGHLRWWMRHRQQDTNGWPNAPQTPTHAQIGRMAAMVTKFSIAVTGAHVHMLGHSPENAHEQAANDADRSVEPQRNNVWFDEHDPSAHADTNVSGTGTPGSNGGATATQDIGGITQEASLHPKLPEWARPAAHDRKHDVSLVQDPLSEDIESEERKATLAKLTVAWSIFLMFWLVGSAIFHATEGWSYGDAMYFCFMAFTTTGYGDFAPVTPAGRSVFVVWALLGVATMTILIAVIEEAGSSKYKDALHSKTFDSAVKKYRIKENKETEKLIAKTRPEAPRQHSDSSLTDAVHAAHDTAQQELERLPNEVLQQARTFHSHMQYFTNTNNVEPNVAAAAPYQSRIPAELHHLLDELADLEAIGERTKKEVMEDDDARNTLLQLSIEHNLRRLINAAERSLAALAERDSLMALKRQRGKEDRNHTREPTKHND